MNKKRVYQIISITVLFLNGAMFLIPIFFLIINSFKPLKEILLSFVSMPKDFTIQNYTGAWNRIDYLSIFFNTLHLAVGAVIITVLFSSLCGYKLQRTRGKISKVLYFYFLIGLIIPFTVIMVPMSMFLLGTLQMGNNLTLLIFVYAALFMPVTVFIYYGYCKSIPLELDEAAMIDGCGQVRTFFQVVLPLTGTILVSIVVLSFLWTWNDFVVVLIAVDDPSLATITRRLNNFVGLFTGGEWDYFTAIVTLAMLPVVLLYALLQKYVQQGLISGAIKG